MSDVYDRDAKEAALAKVLAKEFHRARMKLLGLIPGLDPWMVDVAPEFWAEHQTALVGVTTPLMSGVYVAQAETLLDEFDFLGVDWGLVNEAAVDWAKGYTFELVKGLNVTSQKFLQRTIPQYFEQRWTLAQLRTALAPKGKDGEDIGPFGTKRAGVIARTEVTRAAVEGEIATVQIMDEDGIKMIAFWHTNVDEIVCEICRPLNGRPMDGFTANRPWWIHPDTGENIEPPPAHPNCRCAIGYQMAAS